MSCNAVDFLFHSKTTQRKLGFPRALQAHSKVTPRALQGHFSTWALKSLRHLGTQAIQLLGYSKGHLDTQSLKALRQLDIWALEALEALYLAYSIKAKHNRLFSEDNTIIYNANNIQYIQCILYSRVYLIKLSTKLDRYPLVIPHALVITLTGLLFLINSYIVPGLQSLDLV